MQATSRCPRCGYVLRYDGSNYRCDFCGHYWRKRRALTERIDIFERNLRGRMNRFFQPAKDRSYADFQRVMPTVRRCVSCSMNMPAEAQLCPNCGAAQTSQPAETPEGSLLDKRVLDYILAHEGTISMSLAAHELLISIDVLSTTIDRLKSLGLLKQT